MPQRMDVLDRIAIATGAEHAIADGDRAALLVPASAASYRRYLAAIFAFESRVETSLAQVHELTIKFLVSHLRSGRLAQDLFALGIDPLERLILARSIAVPKFASPAEAIGWLFVIERHALAHAELRARLASLIPDEIRVGGSYLATTPHRGELASLLERRLTTPELVATAVDAAHAAFSAQHAWLAEARTVCASETPRAHARAQTPAALSP